MIKNLLNRFKRKKIQKDSSKLMMTYNRLPISFERGEGLRLWDQNDKEYIDALGGIAVNILGHQHVQFTESIKKAADSVLHVSNLFQIPAQEALGQKLCEITKMDRAFLCNSGTEANEAALKIARKYGNDKNIENPTVITANGSFHGRTMAALAATGNDAVKKGFQPMLSGFIHVPYNDAEAIKEQSGNKDIVAVMLEPIQGESGIIIPDSDYLIKVRAICDENDWLLIMDEIQAGMGRTGQWCAHHHAAIQADVVTIAKALGNGIPIGACLAYGKAAEVLQAGNHGTTFGGNPFAASIALTVIDILEKEQYLAHIEKIGHYLKNSLHLHLDGNENIVEVRGKGLMLAVELHDAHADLSQKFLDHGLIINITGGGKIIRLLPAAIIQESDANEIAKIISKVINSLTINT
jgi:acetylornithine aminotransferase